jgi:hypothetical protein
MTDQLVNLTVFIPWIIMAFVLDEKKLTAENLVSLFPGSQIGNRQYVVALWSRSSRKLIFDKTCPSSSQGTPCTAATVFWKPRR